MSGTAHPAVMLEAALRQAAPAFAMEPARRHLPRPQRSKLWELNGSIHCSIIGTCLTTAELRRAMGKVVTGDVTRFTDHDLHAQAVGLCGHHGPAAKLLQKLLDQRHELAVKRFARIEGDAGVLAAWAEARRSGEIPGAYWAALTHPDTGHEGMRRVFGDVHMLSHLVGAANRADIRRLTALEDENAILRVKVERQQARLQEAIQSRDATIRQLGSLVVAQGTAQGTTQGAAKSAIQGLAPAAATSDPADDALAALQHLVADLQTRLNRELGRRERLEQRCMEASAAAHGCERRAQAAEAATIVAQQELAIIERLQDRSDAGGPAFPLAAQRVVYVGGRPACIDRMRAMIEAVGGTLLSHDGGRHDHPSLLAGLIGQADQAVFPVDCVSHDAALAVKRLCRQSGKRFVPLRSASVASFLAAMAAPVASVSANPAGQRGLNA